MSDKGKNTDTSETEAEAAEAAARTTKEAETPKDQAAAETTKVSPFFALPVSVTPTYAVHPLAPRIPT